MTTRQSRKAQEALFTLLQQAEGEQTPLTEEAIVGATGWKRGTFRDYRSKGHFDD